jgi:hypothetical protein
MAYFIAFDYWNQRIVAYDETWQHAVSRHPELIGKESYVMASLVTPIVLYQSDTHPTTRLYQGPVIETGIYGGTKPISVVEYRSASNRVWKTGYFTSLDPDLKILWEKK